MFWRNVLGVCWVRSAGAKVVLQGKFGIPLIPPLRMDRVMNQPSTGLVCVFFANGRFPFQCSDVCNPADADRRPPAKLGLDNPDW